MKREGDLICKHYPRLDSVPVEDLARLFPSLLDTSHIIPLAQYSGFDGFTLQSIVVFKEDRPILFLPLFEARFGFSTFLDKGCLKKTLGVASRVLPFLFYPRVLGIGFVEGEWSEIGVDPEINSDTIGHAWDLALNALESLAVGLKSDLVAFNNFNSLGLEMLPVAKLKKYIQVPSIPCAQLTTKYQSTEDYIRRLSKNTRKNLHRKARETENVRIVHTRHPEPFLDTIYRFYQEKVEQSDMVFGVHRFSYFQKICGMVPGAEYVLYFVQDELVAFNLLIVKPEVLVDKYFCMDLVPGRKHNLYFISWLENIRYCIENKIPVYHAGQGAEKTKECLGACFIPSFILFRHRKPVIHYFLSMMKNRLSYHPPVHVSQARLSEVWETPNTSQAPKNFI